jgi:adenylyltransferase/sulfurtransferase
MGSNNPFTSETAEALRRAHQIALAKRHAQLEVEHILLALVGEPDSAASQAIEKLGGDAGVLARRLDDALRPNSQLTLDWSGAIRMTARCERTLLAAGEIARRAGAPGVGIPHLLLAILEESTGPAARLLEKMRLDKAALLQALNQPSPMHPGPTAPPLAVSLARYSRQAVLPGVGVEGQRRLLASRVAILGAGALGSALAEQLTRAGVGYLRLADRDYLELHNLQRQTLYTEADVTAALPKAVAAAEHLRAINSQVTVEPWVADVSVENIAALLDGMDLVLDASDNFAARYLLNDACVQRGLPWIYSGVIATAGMTLAIRPGETACLRCLYPDPPPPGSTPTCEVAGVLGPVVQVIAGVAGAAALQILLGAAPPPGLLAVDLWAGAFDRVGDGARDPQCPACGLGRYDFLGDGARAALQNASLCGRATIQIRLGDGALLDLSAVAGRLQAAGVGQVLANPYLVRLTPPTTAGAEATELTLFPDGRVIVKGTEDPAIARSLVARYIGF